jgi:hypothetical protein
MEEDSPFVGFLTSRAFKLRKGLYRKKGFDCGYKLSSDDHFYFITCFLTVPGYSTRQLGNAVHVKGQIFCDEDMETELLQNGMRFLTQTELNQ